MNFYIDRLPLRPNSMVTNGSMTPPSDRKRPFEGQGEEAVIPIGPPSLSSFQPRAQVARQPLSEKRVAVNASSVNAGAGVVHKDASILPTREGPMAPPSDRKRPFEEQEEEAVIPIGPPSSSSFQLRAKAARQPPPEKRVADNASSARAGVVHKDAITLPKCEEEASGTNKEEVIYLLDSDDSESDDEIEFVNVKSKKRVRFNEDLLCEWRYYPVEQRTSLAAIDENEEAHSINSSAIQPSSEHSRATDAFTVISSQHGRARRNLRGISKRDLKAAVKHGKKVPAHPNRRTGENRWKFVHNDIVYITDSTCTQEITSYKEAVTIEPYKLDIPMMEHHTELQRILKEEPYLCTGHTYIIIDQSGSMRNSDVDGFKSRSHAAYGTLSLEFIAEQLSQRPNQGDLFAESVTIVEMKEEGRAIFERVPFDWILFNRLLKIPHHVRPSRGGNYNESLTLVSDMILGEYNSLVEDGAEKRELPHFSMVFLSDGKPSDSNPRYDQKRTEILKSLTDSLQDKFSLYAMGIGARETEFGVLQSMVATVTENGGSGQFVHAGLSTVKLSQTFSQISSTLTSHRTTLLGEENLADAESGDKVEKNFTMRETGKIIGKKMPSEKYLDGKSHAITRYKFDNDLLERNEDPWKEIAFANHGANGVEIETKPFGKGSERLAYRFHETRQDAGGFKRVGKTLVAKNSVHLNTIETKEAFHKDFCLVQATALGLAENFNTAVRLAPQLRPTTKETKPPALKFMQCRVYSIKDKKTKEERSYLVEKLLDGKFTKYNSNNGYVKGANSNTRTIELKSGKVKLDEFVQAFSHWVYEHTEHKMIVCDLQGVLNEEGRYPEFQLTDPAICTRKGNRYGKTDMRLAGLRKFCTTHRCGPVCQGLSLPCMNKSVR